MAIALDDKHDLDTSFWKSSLSVDNVLSEIDNREGTITWLTKSELGLVANGADVKCEMRGDASQPNNKRPRTSPPAASVPNFTKTRDNTPKTMSTLPDRLKSRIYPGQLKHGQLKHVTEETTRGGPFQSATTKYATDCARSGKPVDSNIKKSLGGKNTKVCLAEILESLV